MNNFKYWYEHVADIPLRDEGGSWYDAETGFAFNPDHDYQTNKTMGQRKKISDKAQDARALAKSFGGRALKGTTKQKEWAEKIRAEKLGQMSPELAELVVDPNGLLTHSKFWIEHRDSNGEAIGEFIHQQKTLYKQYQAAREALEHEKVKEISEQYNALTAKWGF